MLHFGVNPACSCNNGSSASTLIPSRCLRRYLTRVRDQTSSCHFWKKPRLPFFNSGVANADVHCSGQLKFSKCAGTATSACAHLHPCVVGLLHIFSSFPIPSAVGYTDHGIRHRHITIAQLIQDTTPEINCNNNGRNGSFLRGLLATS